MKKIIVALVIGLSFIACNTFAATYTFEDNWINWPGYTSLLGDENGTPKIQSMSVTVSDAGILQSIDILMHDNAHRQAYDSLFINSYSKNTTNSAWDDWDYFVHDGDDSYTENTSGTVAADGFYSVKAGFDYTFVTNSNRVGNPNGIDANSLNPIDATFGGSMSGYVLSYDFTNVDLDGGLDVSAGFFIAYAPWCDNDIIGGGTAPVPEPATMVLLGSGLVGLAFYRRKMKK